MNIPGFRLHPLKGSLIGPYRCPAIGVLRFASITAMLLMSTIWIITSEAKAMAMHNPPHPGGIVRRQCLDALNLSVTEAAKGLGVTRQALSDLVNGRAGISIDMAIRLSKAFGSNPETWLGLQMAYDLWQARQRIRLIKVRHFKAA
jgi:addiction module HigA family antidote